MAEKSLRELTEELTLRDELLKENEKTFRTLFCINPLPMCLTSTIDGAFIKANKAFAALSEYSIDEILGKTALDIGFYKNPDDRIKVVSDVMATGKALNMPVDVVTKTGKVLHTEFSTTIVKIDNLHYFITVLADVTERMKLEKLKNINRFSINSTQDEMVIVDVNGKFIDVNKSFCNNSGYTINELLNMTIFDVDLNYSKEKWLETWEVIKTSSPFLVESIHTRKDGTTYPVELSLTYFKYNGDEFHCGIARDISERVKNQKLLQEEKEKYQYLIENIRDVIYSIDVNGNFIFISPLIEDFSGYSIHEIIGKPFFDFVHPDDIKILKEKMEQTLNGTLGQHTFRIILKNGKSKRVRTKSKFDGKNLIGVMCMYEPRKNKFGDSDDRTNT